MNLFIAKVKRRESSFYAFLYHFGKTLLSFNMPVGAFNRWFYISLLGVKHYSTVILRFLRQKLYVEPTAKSLIQIGAKAHIEEIPSINGNGTVIFGESVHISGKFIISFMNKYQDQPRLTIDDATFIGHMTRFSIADKISIGNSVLIGANCMMMDNDGHPHDFKKRRDGVAVKKDKIFPVCIEDDVWLGNGVLVLKGVTIGARSIIAARSVVTKSIPADTIAGGNPCKVIRFLSP